MNTIQILICMEKSARNKKFIRSVSFGRLIKIGEIYNEYVHKTNNRTVYKCTDDGINEHEIKSRITYTRLSNTVIGLFEIQLERITVERFIQNVQRMNASIFCGKNDCSDIEFKIVWNELDYNHQTKWATFYEDKYKEFYNKYAELQKESTDAIQLLNRKINYLCGRLGIEPEDIKLRDS